MTPPQKLDLEAIKRRLQEATRKGYGYEQKNLDLRGLIAEVERMRAIDKTDHRYQPMKYQIIDLEQERDQLKAKVAELEAVLAETQKIMRDNLESAVKVTCKEAKQDRNRLAAENEKLREALDKLIKSIKSDCMICDEDGAKLGAGWAFKDEADAAECYLEQNS